ncbi:anthranilate synthase component I [Elusimicrobiota bacterium]
MNNKNIILKSVSKKIIADKFTPVSVYNIFKDSSYSFLLESVEKGKMGRYTFIGFSPKQVYKLYKDKVAVFNKAQGDKYILNEEISTIDPMEVVRQVHEGYVLHNGSNEPPFCGGLVGYIGYEAIGTWEKIKFDNSNDIALPLGILVFADEMIVFDHIYNTVEIIKLVEEDDYNSSEGKKRTQKRIDEIINILNTSVKPLNDLSLESSRELQIKSNFTEDEFKKRVLNIKEEIFSGEIIQGVFSQRLETPVKGDPYNYYRALRAINPSPYMFYLKLDDMIICGSSPEVMVKVTGSNAMVCPIAGTRPRGKTEEEEEKLIKELQSDTKERAEHVMLVDLGRNDLGRVCKYSTVTVENIMAVEKYSHVMHMVTDVYGKLKDGITGVDVFKACFPAGTVSGAPKIRAIQIIEEQENLARGPYAGAVGYFSFTGDMDMGIIIRTMVIYDGMIYVQAGAGIVADSVPEKEYHETLNKARALLEAVRLGGIE